MTWRSSMLVVAMVLLATAALLLRLVWQRPGVPDSVPAEPERMASRQEAAVPELRSTPLDSAPAGAASDLLPAASDRAAVTDAAVGGVVKIHGQVLDRDHGQPVAGATVLLFAVPLSVAFERVEPTAEQRLPRRTVTDERGEFRFDFEVPADRELSGSLWVHVRGHEVMKQRLRRFAAGQTLFQRFQLDAAPELSAGSDPELVKLLGLLHTVSQNLPR